MFKNGNYWNGDGIDRSNDWVDHCKSVDQQTQRQVAATKAMLDASHVQSVKAEETYPIEGGNYSGADIPLALEVVFWAAFIFFGGPVRAVASLIFIWWLFSG